MRFALCIISLLTFSLAHADDEGLKGNWKVSIFDDGNQVTLWLLQLQNKEGKLAGELTPLRRVGPSKVAELRVDGDRLRFSIQMVNQSFDFEGPLPRAGAKKILGSISLGGQVIPAILESTQAKDAFSLDKEFLTRSPNDPRVFNTVQDLIKQAPEQKAPVKDVQEWTQAALRAAESYGPRWQQEVAIRLAEVLARNKEYAAAALEAARAAEKFIDAKTPAESQMRVLTILGDALRANGQTDDAKKLTARIDKLEAQGHADYSKTALPFKADKVARKSKSNRAVLVELFTGAQCPPCVAADLGFDGLAEAYPSTDVVLLQYHLHIPGPDALTNPDCEARSDFYARSIRGTPTIFFNGKTGPQGGGGREDAGEKFDEYRGVVEKLLALETAIKVDVEATRKGDKISIRTKVANLEKTDKMRLRLALVEEWVRYRGRNGLSYHHHVVRAMPGGANGFALTGTYDNTIAVDLAELKTTLTKYLDNFAAKEEPFPDAQRPLSFRNLRVVALVQNDATNEVLQAAETVVREQ